MIAWRAFVLQTGNSNAIVDLQTSHQMVMFLRMQR